MTNISKTCKELSEQETKQVVGGKTHRTTNMVCKACGYSTTWAGDYAGKGPYTCQRCGEEEVWGSR